MSSRALKRIHRRTNVVLEHVAQRGVDAYSNGEVHDNLYALERPLSRSKSARVCATDSAASYIVQVDFAKRVTRLESVLEYTPNQAARTDDEHVCHNRIRF
jgi:hypothetical protein